MEGLDEDFSFESNVHARKKNTNSQVEIRLRVSRVGNRHDRDFSGISGCREDLFYFWGQVFVRLDAGQSERRGLVHGADRHEANARGCNDLFPLGIALVTFENNHQVRRLIGLLKGLQAVGS